MASRGPRSSPQASVSGSRRLRRAAIASVAAPRSRPSTVLQFCNPAILQSCNRSSFVSQGFGWIDARRPAGRQIRGDEGGEEHRRRPGPTRRSRIRLRCFCRRGTSRQVPEALRDCPARSGRGPRWRAVLRKRWGGRIRDLPKTTLILPIVRTRTWTTFCVSGFPVPSQSTRGPRPSDARSPGRS